MPCPKCGFDGESEDQCPRCGVVFEKLGARPPRRLPSPSTPRVGPRRPIVSRGFLWSLPLLGALYVAARLFVAAVPPSPSFYGLLPLDSRTVTRGAVERARAVAEEHPRVPVLKAYVGRALLLLALRHSHEGRAEEAESVLAEAEAYGAPPGDVAAVRAFVARNEGLWEEASRWASRAVELDTDVDRAEAHHIIGVARYYREDLPGAVEELEKALALSHRPSIRSSLDHARRDLEIEGRFARVVVPHFVIRYDPATMVAPTRLAMETLETSYQALVSEMGFERRERIAVVLYSRADYLAVGGDEEATGLYDGKIRVSVSDIEENEAWIRETLRHELAHAFVQSRGGFGVPRWLHEGIAHYVSGHGTAELVARLKPPVEPGSLASCVVEDACDRRTFYRAASSMVDYIVQFRGMGGIRDVLDGLKQGRTLDESLERVVGTGERELAQEWERYVERRLR